MESAEAFKNVTAISSLGLPKNDPSYHAKILMSEYIPTGHYEVQDSRPNPVRATGGDKGRWSSGETVLHRYSS